MCSKIPGITLILLIAHFVAVGQSIDSLQRIVENGNYDGNTAAYIAALTKLVGHFRGKDDVKAAVYMRKLMTVSGSDAVQTARIYISYGLFMSDQGRYDSADYYFEKANVIVKDNPQELTLTSAYHTGLGLLERKKGNNEEALRHYKIVDRLGEDVVGKENMAGNLLNMANIQYRTGSRSEAIGLYFRALRLFESAGNEKGISYCYNSLGVALNQQGRSAEAKAYLLKSLAIKERDGDKKGITTTCNELAGVFLNLKDYTRAHQYADRMLALTRELGLHELYITALINKGKILRIQGSLEEAERMFSEARPLAEKLPNSFILSSLESEIGKLYSERRKNDEAIEQLESSLDVAQRSRNKEAELNAYLFLAEAHYRNKQYKDAYEAYQRFHVLEDSLRGKTLNLAYQELETKYEVEKKNAEIALLKKDNVIQAEQEKKQRAIQTGIAIALGSFILIGVVLVNRYRIVSRTKRLLELERVRNAIARDLHDDIGSTISSINILSNVAISHTVSNPEAKNHIKKIADQSASIMERMSDIVWSINPVNDSLSAVSAKMKEFTAEILDPKNIQYVFTGIDEIADTTLSIEAKRNIYLTYKEILNNAAKYSGATLVTINIGLKEESLVLNVSDNGCGFDPKEVRRGNGLRNIAARSTAMNASCTITSSPGSGTSIDVVIPLT